VRAARSSAVMVATLSSRRVTIDNRRLCLEVELGAEPTQG